MSTYPNICSQPPTKRFIRHGLNETTTTILLLMQLGTIPDWFILSGYTQLERRGKNLIRGAKSILGQWDGFWESLATVALRQLQPQRETIL